MTARIEARDTFSLDGKVVLISGGSRGIGLAIANGCRSAGARVIVSARDERSLAATGFEYVACDVLDESAIRRAVEHVSGTFGTINVLFNVAGVNFRHAALTFPSDQLDRIYGVNVRGAFLMAREVGVAMAADGGGKVVNIASLHSMHSLPGVSAYGASKGALASLTRALAVEWAPLNIQVNAIAPGLIRTDLNATLWKDPAMLQWVEGRTPAHRLGSPEDVVGAALFLATPASDFVTGQILFVDGGISAGSPWPLEVPL
jgi:gluconate 5-dehydrogenase